MHIGMEEIGGRLNEGTPGVPGRVDRQLIAASSFARMRVCKFFAGGGPIHAGLQFPACSISYKIVRLDKVQGLSHSPDWPLLLEHFQIER